MFNKDIALEMANLAQLAYTQKSSTQQFSSGLNSINYNLLGEFQAKLPIGNSTEVFGFIAESNDKSVLSFRGTDSIMDFITDIQAEQVPLSKSFWWWYKPAMVHYGFYACYESCITQITDILNKITKPLYITGHSLGSSAAVLAFIHLYKQYNPILYTFACPRVGDKEFVKEYNSYMTNACNIVNKNDIVPHLPPDEVIDDLKVWNYASFQSKYYLDFQKYNIIDNHRIANYIKAMQVL